MRYYVTTPEGEKGPYEEEYIRAWLRDGTMPSDASVRREDEAMGRPASVVFPGERPQSPFAGSAGGFGAPPNVYAPPIETSGGGWANLNQGSFGKGFVFGFFCGCLALFISFVSDGMGEETKRGVRWGFAVGLVLGVLGRVIAAANSVRSSY